MFSNLCYITDVNGAGAAADYHADGVYFTFVFRDGRCFEHNEERDRIEAMGR